MQISSECRLGMSHRTEPTPLRSCNWLGVQASILAMDWYGNKTLHETPFTNMTIKGTPVAAIQNVDQFTFA